MDPLESIYSSFPGYNNLSEPLVRVDKDWQVVPGQATKWEVSPDGLSWTFDLQPGLMWTNGDEVTADDYVASFQYAADPSMRGTSPGTTTASSATSDEAVSGRGADLRESASRSARTSTRSCSRRSARRRSCPRCSSGRHRSTRSPSRSTARASTTSTRRRP